MNKAPSSAAPYQATTPYARFRRRDQPGRRLQTVHKAGPIYDVAPDVLGVKTAIVNLYLIGAPGSSHWVLVDAGMPGHAGMIREIAARRFGRNVPPAAIVLTHGHFDHTGSLQALLKTWEVPIYVHRAELPFVTGRSSYAPPDPTVGGGLMAWASFVFPKHPIDLGSRVKAIGPDGEIPELPDWRAVPTPGHTPGHISLFRDEDRVLIAGDAFVTIQAEALSANLSLAPVVGRPPAYFTPDWPAAKLSIQRLAEMEPSVVATGHGQPLYGDAMRRALLLLAYEFERHPHGLPRKGRYREIPALFDDATGLTRLPPAPVLPYVVGIGLFVVAAAVLSTMLRFGSEDD